MARDMSVLRAVCTVALYSCSLLCTLRLVCGQVHCYCNSPKCASNYMCESEIGCYSHLVESNGESNSPYLHGCIESITVERCEEAATSSNETTSTTAPSALTAIEAEEEADVNFKKARDLSCCYESMCNFEDGSKVMNDPVKDEIDEHYTQPYEAASEQALWFRAAVIAVPIAGACILIGLIMIAARMLRSEDKQFTKLNVHDVVRGRQRALRHTTRNAPRNTTVHRAPVFLDNSRVKNINITGNKLVDARQELRPHTHQNKINNVSNVAKVTNELLHHQRCVNECPRLIPAQHCEKLYRENFDVV